MTDKSWMLNAKAIAAAKKCISIVEAELGVRLKLSHPEFIELLFDYAELNESAQLREAVKLLANYAPAAIKHRLEPVQKSNVIKLGDKTALLSKVGQKISEKLTDLQVSYKGKLYPRYQDGAEFKGFYRGQPHYA